jgi:hypothetical protein
MRYRTLGYTALLGLLLLLFAAEVSASGLQANLDRTQVAEGDTVMLTLSAPANVSGTPDLSPLRQDFDLLDQSQSTHTRIINGQGSSSREWRINLAPKHSGKLSVPALHWGSLSSQAQGLEVLPAGKAAQLGMARPALLEVEAKPEHPYVQSKVVYTVRLLYRAALQQASLSEPQADNAIIERLGKDKRYNTERDGQPYQVIERRYAICPQASGKLEIKPPVLSAQILDTGRQRSSRRHHVFGGGDPFADIDSFFGNNGFPDMGVFSGQTRPVELRGRSIALKVKPQPAGAMSPWLPAESLSLNEAWSPDPPQFHVGEPVTRTVAITAQGLSASQLPDLDLPVTPGIKAYPDKPQTETHASGDTLVAQKIFKLALVPSQAGSYTLPAIHLKWWDIATGKVKTAQLPAREITVLPAAGGTASPSQPTPAFAQAPVGGASSPQPASSAPVATGGSGVLPSASGTRLPSITATGYWPWLSAFFALAWLVSSGLWLRARKANGRHAPPAGAPVESPPADAAKSRKRLEQACRNNDARAARQALIEWAAAQWPALAPGRLEVVAQRLGPDAREIVQQLDRGLYAQGRLDWDGVAAWSRLSPALDKARQGGREVHRETALPPLYPQGA